MYGQTRWPSQLTSQAGRDAADADAIANVREVHPEAYYFRDHDGKLVLVPDITLEELARLLRLGRGLERPDEPPSFTITELLAEGSVVGNAEASTPRAPTPS